MLNFCGIVMAILKMENGRNCSMSGINSGHHNLPTWWNFVEIGHCWICAVLWQPFWKWRPVDIFECRESIRDIIIYPHMYFDDIGQCWIFVAILQMATARNFSMSGINSGHHNLFGRLNKLHLSCCFVILFCSNMHMIFFFFYA